MFHFSIPQFFMRRATISVLGKCCVRSAALPPFPDLLVSGRWLCVTPFRMFCLYRAVIFSNNVSMSDALFVPK
jgi:hypothetical protein